MKSKLILSLMFLMILIQSGIIFDYVFYRPMVAKLKRAETLTWIADNIDSAIAKGLPQEGYLSIDMFPKSATEKQPLTERLSGRIIDSNGRPFEYYIQGDRVRIGTSPR